MPVRSFLGFVLPSLLAMVLLIALPLLSAAWQSLHVEHPQVLVTVEACDPFGCTTDTRVDAEAMARLNREQPQGRFNGFGTYLDAGHLATAEIRAIWASAPDLGSALRGIARLPFYEALLFTLAFALVVSPLALALGFLLALAVSALPRAARGPIIYLTLLPMIVPSVIGAMTLFWMIDQRGLIGAFLRWVTGDPGLSLKASATLTWATILAHGVWSSTPWVFIVFYAALRTVPRDTLEAAMVDGASRWERLRAVTLPHLRPVATFLLLILLLDNFNVFDAIIGLNAEAHASSLATRIFHALRTGGAPLFGSAAATSMLMVLLVLLLLVPSLRRARQDFRAKA